MKRMDKDTEKLVVSDKKNGKTLKYIMEKYNIKSTRTIYQIIKREGKEYVIPNKKYDVNADYFENIDTQDKSYWLGFLYADGYVRMKDGRSGELKLKLKKSDKKHIELFRKCIGSTHKIIDGISKVVVSGRTYESECSSLSVYNTKIVKDLFSCGCVNNKTFKINIPKLSSDLIRHFIRGYFDGDGCVCGMKKRIRFGFTSGSNMFLQQLKNILIKECKLGDNKINNFDISWTRKGDLLNFYHYIYDNSTIYLKRKKEKFDYIVNDKTRKVVGVVENGKTIKKWKHINDCAKELQIGTSTIMKKCRGEIKNNENLKLVDIGFFDN